MVVEKKICGKTIKDAKKIVKKLRKGKGNWAILFDKRVKKPSTCASYSPRSGVCRKHGRKSCIGISVCPDYKRYK